MLMIAMGLVARDAKSTRRDRRVVNQDVQHWRIAETRTVSFIRQKAMITRVVTVISDIFMSKYNRREG